MGNFTGGTQEDGANAFFTSTMNTREQEESSNRSSEKVDHYFSTISLCFVFASLYFDFFLRILTKTIITVLYALE